MVHFRPKPQIRLNQDSRLAFRYPAQEVFQGPGPGNVVVPGTMADFRTIDPVTALFDAEDTFGEDPVEDIFGKIPGVA